MDADGRPPPLPAPTWAPLSSADAAAVADLVGRAMDDDEGRWARTTLERHVRLRALGVDDGREYVRSLADGRPVGVAGLHVYEWGPPDNVWLGWFAVDPAWRGRGLGAALLANVEARAAARGLRRLFVETYDTPTFHAALRFYRRAGFTDAGRIDGYLPSGASMLVLRKDLPAAPREGR